MKAEDKINLTEEQRDELARRETRNKAIAIGIGLIASVASMIVERRLEKNLIAEFTTTDETETQDEEDSTP